MNAAHGAIQPVHGGTHFAGPTLRFARRVLLGAAVAAFVLTGVATTFGQAKWEGVDKTVVEKFAEEAGHPAREPYLNTDQGDLLLFLFLLAGAAGGFVAGYAFRALFPPRQKIPANETCPR